MRNTEHYFSLDANPRLLSYLPLSNIAELQLVFVRSLTYAGTITFNESLETLARDMADTKPHFFFGPPRVWEQLQQGVLAMFGSQQAPDNALEENSEPVGLKVRMA